ncbi:MAG: ribosome rescue protein RqcH [Candidatus Thermoplasmatota archaeon]|nr:ribosome rescue protein RqcH [Candidatus Thermoplasmatota archaeon]
MERKEQLSSLDFGVLVKELQALINSRVDKIHQISNQELLIRLRAKDRKINLFINTLGWVFVVSKGEKIALPSALSDFALGLRKYIANGIITKIVQKDFDRIIELEIKKANANYKLVLELFGKGNVVLVHENKVLLCASKLVRRHRIVKPSSEYLYPPSKISILRVSAEDFKSLLSSKRSIASILVSDFNLSKIYVQEACQLVNIDPRAIANSLDVDKIISLYNKIKELVEGSAKPRIVFKDGKPLDVVPIPLSLYDNYEFKELSTFNNAVEEFYWLLQKELEEEKEKAALKKELEKLQYILSAQEQKLIDYEKEAIDGKEFGDLITENYLELEELLKRIARNEDVSKFRVSELNKKEGFVEVVIKNKKLKLDLRKSAFENAAHYYQLSKKAKRKASSVKNAILETEQKIEKLGKEAPSAVKEPIEKKKFWFEKYKWFITSDNVLVLAGRDAGSNERLVKRHLKADCAYVHAEVHGAPSVVVRGRSDTALKEACEFALLHSKAWSSKLASGDAYWVLAHQVSKSAKAGEYVPKGAFVITGKKNYFRNLNVSAGIGLIKIDGIDNVMCAPAATTQKKCTSYVIFEPGVVDKQEFAKKVAKAFNIDIEKIMRILPPGSVKVLECKNIRL